MRFLYIVLVCVFLPNVVCAQSYEFPTLETLIDTTYADGLIDLSDNTQFTEYVQIKDCEAYKATYADDFKWQALKKQVQDKADSSVGNVQRFFKVNSNLRISRYNFDTLAFDIAPESQLNNVRYLQVFAADRVVCGSNSSDNIAFKGMPAEFQIELDAPFSMYRLPVGQGLGKRMLDELEMAEGQKNTRNVYITTYLTLDSMDRFGQTAGGARIAVGVGRIDKMEFFADQARTRRFKTLYPSLD